MGLFCERDTELMDIGMDIGDGSEPLIAVSKRKHRDHPLANRVFHLRDSSSYQEVMLSLDGRCLRLSSTDSSAFDMPLPLMFVAVEDWPNTYLLFNASEHEGRWVACESHS